MQRQKTLRNFIIYAFLLLLTLTVSNDCCAALSEARQLQFLQDRQQLSMSAEDFSAPDYPVSSAAVKGTLFLSAPGMAQPVSFLVRRITGTHSAISASTGLKSLRSFSHERRSFLFLFCILTLLSVYAASSESLLLLHDSRHIHRAPFLIFFMQDMDGRKRSLNSHCTANKFIECEEKRIWKSVSDFGLLSL